jgi:hypothetical protein
MRTRAVREAQMVDKASGNNLANHQTDQKRFFWRDLTLNWGVT